MSINSKNVVNTDKCSQSSPKRAESTGPNDDGSSPSPSSHKTVSSSSQSSSPSNCDNLPDTSAIVSKFPSPLPQNSSFALTSDCTKYCCLYDCGRRPDVSKEDAGEPGPKASDGKHRNRNGEHQSLNRSCFSSEEGRNSDDIILCSASKICVSPTRDTSTPSECVDVDSNSKYMGVSPASARSMHLDNEPTSIPESDESVDHRSRTINHQQSTKRDIARGDCPTLRSHHDLINSEHFHSPSALSKSKARIPSLYRHTVNDVPVTQNNDANAADNLFSCTHVDFRKGSPNGTHRTGEIKEELSALGVTNDTQNRTVTSKHELVKGDALTCVQLLPHRNTSPTNTNSTRISIPSDEYVEKLGGASGDDSQRDGNVAALSQKGISGQTMYSGDTKSHVITHDNGFKFTIRTECKPSFTRWFPSTGTVNVVGCLYLGP